MLLPNTYYHIYNHANANENLFRCDENYSFFLDRTYTLITPVADIFVYCLMPNHFHFLVKTKSVDEIVKLPIFDKYNLRFKKTATELVSVILSKQFGNLFSSYTQSYNKLYGRRGSLFLKNFKNVIISNKKQFKNVVHYIHNNPIHHGFAKDIDSWKWTSYQTIVSTKKASIKKEEVITWFGEISQFVEFHKSPSAQID